MAFGLGNTFGRLGASGKRGTSTPAGPPSIGGVVIGSAGTGTFSGYTLAGGTDFANSLSADLIRPDNPYGNYANNFSDRDRRRTSSTSVFSMADQYWTGWQDANDGVPVSSFSDMMTVSSSVITVKARRATVSEKALLGVRDNTSAPITYVTGGDANGTSSKRPMVAACPAMAACYGSTGDRIIAVRWRYNGGGIPIGTITNPISAIWTLNVRGGSEVGDDASNGGTNNWNDEIDYMESYTGTPPGIATLNRAAGLSSTSGGYGVKTNGTWQRLLITLTNASGVFSTLDDDGVTVLGTPATLTNSSGNQTQTYYDMFGAFITTLNFDETTWVGKELSIDVDYFQVWVPTGQAALRPLVGNATPIVIDFGSSSSYVIPSQASLWGGAVTTEYIRFESAYDTNGPGRLSDDLNPSTFFRDILPTGVTYNSGTRTLTLSPAFASQPGMIVGYVYPSKSGVGYVEPHKIAVYVKPKVTIPAITAPTPGSPYTFTFPSRATLRYWDNGNCPHGSHSGLTLVSGPGWLSYDPVTMTLSGNCPGGFTPTTVTFRCTNGLGHFNEVTVPFPNTQPAYQSWSGPGLFDASDAATVATSGSVVTSFTNKKGGGNLSPVGTSAANITYVAAAQNGLNAVRVVRDVSSVAAVPALKASSSAAVSQAFQGDDQPFTLLIAFKPTDTNTSFPWSASQTTDTGNINFKQVSIVRRDAAASDIRRTMTTAAGQVSQTFGSGDASGTGRVMAVKFSGKLVTLWDNSTTKALNGVSLNVGDMGTALSFYLFAAESSGVVVPTRQATQGNMDFYECVIHTAYLPDAEIQQAITDMKTKWGL